MTSSMVEARREHVSFFRQGGWMVLATGVAGACFTFTHTFAGRMADDPASASEYALFAALLDSTYLLTIPSGGLQLVFAKMAASAVDERRRAELRTAARRVLLTVGAVWLVAAGIIWLVRDDVMASLKIREPAGLWLTLLVGLAGLCIPVFSGLLQGAQRFLWLGWASILSGAGRLVAVMVAVVLLGGLAAGAMGGVLAGSMAAVGLAAWASRDLWMGRGVEGSGWPWVRPWIALTLGLAAGTLMLSVDTLVVQHVFDDERKAFYAAAGRVGRGLFALTTPLALVLFPKVARSAATGEPTAALKLALGATLGTGIAAAVACTLFPSLPVTILYAGNEKFRPAAELVPLFCWCMLPLTAAYTLVNNLLARGRFAAVPWLLLVALGYAATLWALRGELAEREMFAAFRLVIRVLGGFSLLLLSVAVLFSFRRTPGDAPEAPPA